MTRGDGGTSGGDAGFKIPESVLVVIFTPMLDVLLIRRADVPGDAQLPYWQSVTGSKDFLSEPLRDTAVREVAEETGLDANAPGCRLRDWGLTNVYDIYPAWRARYAEGVTCNVEHLFGLCIPKPCPVQLNPREHTDHAWLPWREAADQCFSPSNAEACLLLPRLVAEGIA